MPQLDGLRFLAFFLVFFHHFPPAAKYFAQNSFAQCIFEKLSQFGWIGVDIFLCLSSFLLTSLLIMEHQNTGNISIKQFLIRRALRIWPLYYLVILLSFTIFPATHFFSPGMHTASYTALVKEQLFPFSIFMGNFSYVYFMNSLTVAIAPLWTVCLEEQFYICWPILLFILLPRSKKWFFIALGGLIILSFAVRLYIWENSIPYPTIWVFTLARLDPFALGAAMSYIYLNPRGKRWPWLALCVAVFLFRLVVCSTVIQGNGKNTFWQFFTVDVAACLLIYAALYCNIISKILSLKIVTWLGKISFGLYVFHDLMINIMIAYVIPIFLHGKYFVDATLGYWVLGFIIALALTIACAALSYYGFEKHFLKLKTPVYHYCLSTCIIIDDCRGIRYISDC